MGWTVKIHTLDVGQGDSSLIQIIETDEETGKSKFTNVLIDGGEADQDEKLLGYFSELSLSQIDLIVITHGDTDHYRGIWSLLLKDNYWHFCKVICWTVLDSLKKVIREEEEEILEKFYEQEDHEELESRIKLQVDEALKDLGVWKRVSMEKYGTILEKYTVQLTDFLFEWFCINKSYEPEEVINWIEEEENETNSLILRELYRNTTFRYLAVPFFEDPQLSSGYFKNTRILLNADTYSKATLEVFRGERISSILQINQDSKYYASYGVKREITVCQAADIGEELFSALHILEKDVPVKLVLAAANGQASAENDQPVKEDSNKKNCNSIALLLNFQNFLYYTGGDLPADGERWVAENLANNIYKELQGASWDCVGFKAGHHGSKTCTREDGILALNPSYGVISCGDTLSRYDRDFDHPSQETVERLNACASLKVFFATACVHPIKNFYQKGVITGYMKTKSSIRSRRERLSKIDSVRL